MSKNIRKLLIKNANLTVTKEAKELIQQTWLIDEPQCPSTSSTKLELQSSFEENHCSVQFHELLDALNHGNGLLNENSNLSLNESETAEFLLHPFECSFLGLDKISSQISNYDLSTHRPISRELEHKLDSEKNVNDLDNDVTSKLVCVECGFLANNRTQLWRHGKKEHQIRGLQDQDQKRPRLAAAAYKCTQCNLVTTSSFNLMRHIQRIHTKKKNYACHHCNTNFKDNDTLQTHIKYKHQIERNFQCTKCEKSFVSSSDLTRHLKMVHLNMRCFVCPNCKKSFHTAANAKRHFGEVCIKKMKTISRES